ncbi:MAG: outer membrane lipoprotein carrier protein LolA [Anaeromyxobacter sp.]
MVTAITLALFLAAPAPSPGTPPERPAALPAAAVDPAAAALAAKVQAFYDRTKDLTARFRQTYTYAGFGRKQVSSGKLSVKKPGMMRWDYEKPEPKTVAVKGARLVQFEPEANQAYVDERFDSTALSAAVTFLIGKGDLQKEFVPSLEPSGTLRLTPRQADSRVASVFLSVAADGQVEATRVVDGSGNVNEIRFEDVRRNVGLADAAFEVKLPSNVHRVAPPG